MGMLPVDQLNRPLTPEEVEATLYKIQEKLDLPVTAWQKGGVVRLLNKAFAHMVSLLTRLIVWLFRSGFLDTAEGHYLTRLAWDRYRVERIPETRAEGPVSVENNSQNVYQFQPGELVVQNPATKVTYINTQIVDIGAFEEVTIAVRAEVAGIIGTSAPFGIDTVVAQYTGLSVTNPTSIIGFDEETDEELRQRCRESMARISPNGPRDAYVYIAKSTKRPDGSFIRVNRVWVSPHGVPVQVRVAGPLGPIVGDNAITTTDLGMIQAAVDKEVVPNGITAQVAAPAAKAISFNVELYVDATAAILDSGYANAVRTALINYITSVPIGGHKLTSGQALGKLYANALIGVIKATPSVGQHIVNSTINIGDTDILDNEVATEGVINVNVNPVSIA